MPTVDIEGYHTGARRQSAHLSSQSSPCIVSGGASMKGLAPGTYIIPVSNGIFAHCERIGAAIWVFLWLIDKTTKEVPAGGKVDGLVLDGRSVAIGEIVSDLPLSHRTVREHLFRLAEAGYWPPGAIDRQHTKRPHLRLSGKRERAGGYSRRPSTAARAMRTKVSSSKPKVKMSHVCSVCQSARTREIDELLVNGTPTRNIAKLFRIGASSVYRHKMTCLPKSMIRAKEAEKVGDADSVVTQVQTLLTRAWKLCDQTERTKDYKAAISGVRAASSNS